jgi:branched-chain amino acid transport system permease protein
MMRSRLVLLALLVALAILPFLPVPVPGLLPGLLQQPGSLQLLALCLVFAGVALSYDLLFGHTGLLSFGHALFFATGAYVAAIALSRWHWALLPVLGLTCLVGLLLPLVLGAVSLRVSGIAFAMVTLAFAQAGSILAYKNPAGITGGEEGLGLVVNRLPDFMVGVVNTQNLYWMALAYLVVACLLSWWLVGSRPGRVWHAIRENPLRVEVLGLDTYPFRLLAFVSGGLLATLGGFVYLFLVSGASPDATSANMSLSLLVMVVLGGAGSRWGAVLGGFVYEYLNVRLSSLASSQAIHSLPGVLAVPLSQPLFILGTLLVVLVLFFPGGIAAIPERIRGRRGPLLPERSEPEEAVV